MNLIKAISFCAAVLLQTAAISQPAWQWAKSFQGTGYVYPYAVVMDGTGNIFLSGLFQGTVDFDPGSGQHLITATGEDGFLLKMTPGGDFNWAISLGGTGYDGVLDMALDSLGNIYCTGYFENTLHFYAGLGTDSLVSAGFTDAFLVAFDSTGEVTWSGSVGGSGLDYGMSVAPGLKLADGISWAGVFSNTADLDPSVNVDTFQAVGYQDAYVCHTDLAGNFSFAIQLGGSSSSINWLETAMDFSSNILIAGNFDGSVDFDPSLSTHVLVSSGSPPGGDDAFVLKLTSAGALAWVRQVGNSDYTYCHSLSLDPRNGDVYFAGRFYGVTDFDPGPASFFISPASDAMFVSKLDSSGNFSWAKSIDASSGSVDARFTVVFSPFHNACHISGVFTGGVDMDPGPGILYTGSMGFDDIFLMYLDSAGIFRWVKQLGDVSSETGVIMNLERQGNAVPVISAMFSSPSLNFGGWHLYNSVAGVVSFVAKPNYISLEVQDRARTYPLAVFPVPANDKLKAGGWKTAGDIAISLDILDSKGRLLYSQKLLPGSGSETELDVSMLVPGIYFLRVRGEEELVSRFSILR